MRDAASVDPHLRALSLCAGIGGLDLAARRVLGARAIALVEREAAALEVLAARMEDGTLRLNPRFVEALMGFRAGWTACASLVTPSAPSRRSMQSDNS